MYHLFSRKKLCYAKHTIFYNKLMLRDPLFINNEHRAAPLFIKKCVWRRPFDETKRESQNPMD